MGSGGGAPQGWLISLPCPVGITDAGQLVEEWEQLMTTSTTSRVLSVPDLRSQFEGRLLAPDDEGYDDARVTTYGGPSPDRP